MKDDNNLEGEMNIIYKIIWSYVKGNPGLQFEDLLSEACLIYLETMNLYDKEKGERSTYIYHVVRNRINSLLHYNYPYSKKECHLDEDLMNLLYSNEPTPEQALIQKEHWEELFGDLSPEAKFICNIIFNDANIYLPINTPKKCRGIIIKELRKDNWSWNAIWRTIRELKDAVVQDA